jgi:hypothetical protein
MGALSVSQAVRYCLSIAEPDRAGRVIRTVVVGGGGIVTAVAGSEVGRAWRLPSIAQCGCRDAFALAGDPVGAFESPRWVVRPSHAVAPKGHAAE